MFKAALTLILIALMVACISPPASQEKTPETTPISSALTTTTSTTSTIIASTLPTTSIIPACVMNSDCGSTQEEYICIGGDLWLKKTIPLCKNPGDERAECITRIRPPILIDECEEDEKCVEGNKSCNPK